MTHKKKISYNKSQQDTHFLQFIW